MLTCGGADIVADAEREIRGDSSGFGSSFAGQVRRLLFAHGIEGILVCSNSKGGELRQGNVLSINIPRLAERFGALGFHLSRTLYGIKLARYAHRNQVDLAIIDSGTAHYFSLTAFRIFQIPVAVNFHNVRWPTGFEPKGIVKRTIRILDSAFFRHVPVAALGCSPECQNQARADGADGLPFFGWTAQYKRGGFSSGVNEQTPDQPFRLMFAGRVERNKGVFDLLTMMAALDERPGRSVVIEICGDGAALPELRSEVSRLNLDSVVTIRGRLSGLDLADAYLRSDAVVVPTRGDFCEGMPLVCAEAVLSGKPIITSELSNALPVLGAAIIEAQPENIESYIDAIEALVNQPGTYSQLQAGCATVSGQFFDRSKCYAAAVDRTITATFPYHVPLADYEAIAT